METRKSSKPTGPYGGGSRSSRASQNPISGPSPAARPQYKERVRSAPLGVPQVDDLQQQKTALQAFPGKIRRESQASNPGSRLLVPLSVAAFGESAVHVQSLETHGHVITSNA